MKKINVLLVMLAAAGLLQGCSGNKTSSGSDTTTAAGIARNQPLF